MESQTIITKSERPNSYEFGKSGNRFKIYFESPEDLKKQIDELIKLGFNIE